MGGGAAPDGGNGRLIVDANNDEDALVKCDGNEFDVEGEIELGQWLWCRLGSIHAAYT